MFNKSLFFVLFVFSSLLSAEPLGYEKITPAQPTQNPDKVEVIEFFWYGCPHCYSFEPTLAEWLKNKPDNVEFIRIPAVFSKLWGDHAKAYFTAEALGVVDKVHADLFDAIQNKKQALRSEDDLAKFFVEHGVDETEFRNAYKSFLVDAKLRQAESMPPRYGVTGVPAIIINGKYKTNGPLAKSQKNMIKVMNELIAKESEQ
ncbi:thiol:disulfide interchange protein DsbA/DsbL [Methylomarinum sp. Ch1-1]|uniref:Thiol:disulfide interchange protein n=1 Tax=Methylomarinum roseum TaxID=3067653 RepID=A0AAU7NVU7_9GAMM|nr:thiol:disulfide interchange protein DsbA/DsbL [Methylomarinum sp. Ch1-1]MDP4522824.1 thiol:disulfide interchange protein DsbA/DsbL [Methylomarinum sp. Ch1-1]